VRRLVALGAALLLLVAVAGFEPATPPRLRSAILLSWDGVAREHLEESLGRRELPHLGALIRRGRLVDIDIVGHVTDTRSGHAQMLTGYDPAVTGVYSNARFRPIPRGLSIFERLTGAHGRQGIVTIMLTGKPMGLGPGLPRPPALAETADEHGKDAVPADEADRAARRCERLRLASERNLFGEPWHLIKQELTVWDGDLPREAWSVGAKALAYLDRYAGDGRFFAFIHFADTDTMGHKHGERSKEYDAALIELDAWLGKIVAKLKEKRAFDHTLIYVTADHGFDLGTSHHAEATRIFLATNDPLVGGRGDQRDITPTILSAMGVDLKKLEPPLPGKPLRRRR
jgi:hypothetical protein